MSKNGTILLAEGNSDDALLLQNAFHEAKVEQSLFVVQNGEQAIRYLAGEGQYADRQNFPFPFLLLLELELPLNGGFQVLEWIAAHPESRRALTPVVLTAVDLSPLQERAYDLGAHSYLIKPLDFRDLVKMITRVKDYWIETNRRPNF